MAPQSVKTCGSEVAMGRFTAGVASVLRGLLVPEELPPGPPPTSPLPPSSSRGARPGTTAALARLLGPDELPPDLPPVPRRPGRWLAWLFAAEPLDP
jgi:hypothetical protein